jgi:hypothetical protein
VASYRAKLRRAKLGASRALHQAQERDMTEQQQNGSDKYRDVRAFHNQMPPLPKPLRVSGEYHLNLRSGAAELRVANPQGINPDILLLDLVIAHGNGGDWVPFEGEFPMDVGQYSSVQIVDHDANSIGTDIETAS